MTKKHFVSRVHFIQKLNQDTFILRFDRHEFQFMSGQYVVIGLKGDREKREYSICSPVDSNYLEVLVKQIPNGNISQKLAYLKSGDLIEVSGPFGFFIIPDKDKKLPFYFIATGTGISPFLSFVQSHPNLRYKLLYGIKYQKDYFFEELFPKDQTVLCTSQEMNCGIQERVTDYLKRTKPDRNALYYLCGNSQMIEDCSDILENKGIDSRNIRTERFF